MATQSEGNSGKSNWLAILLDMAMFVLVVDTSIMNVSISAIVNDLDTTVSNIQAAIAPLSLSMFGIALLAGRRAGKRREASSSVLDLSRCQ